MTTKWPQPGDIGYYWDGDTNIVCVRCTGKSGTWRDWIGTETNKNERFRTNGCFWMGRTRRWLMPDPDRVAMFAVRCLSEKWHKDPTRLRGMIHTLCKTAEYWKINTEGGR